jgi:hypothetical protein
MLVRNTLSIKLSCSKEGRIAIVTEAGLDAMDGGIIREGQEALPIRPAARAPHFNARTAW